jgi:hypothetical protein
MAGEMSAGGSAPGFSLADGGPLHRLTLAGAAWGSPRGAMLVGLAAWLPLLAASIAQGLLSSEGGFAQDVGIHARLLLAVPLAVAAERPITARLDRAVRYLTEAGLIHDDNRAACLDAIRHAERLRDSSLSELLLAIVALALSYVDLEHQPLGVRTWMFPSGPDGHQASVAGWICLAWSAPLGRLVILRWGYRFVIWAVLLSSLARARLRINPAHPDGRGGLLVLFDAHTSFGWLGMAVSIAAAGALWTEKARTGASVLDYRLEVLLFSLGAPLFFLLPLFAFSWPIEQARRRFRAEYGSAASDFVARYASRWIHPESRDALPLGTGETSAHTDLVTSFGRVESTYWVPFTPLQYLTLFLAVVAPMVVFTLQEIPLLDLLRRVKETIG